MTVRGAHRAGSDTQRKAVNLYQRIFGAVALIHALLVVAQPVLAGMSLDGRSVALELHYGNAMVIMSAAFIQTLLGLLWWKPGRGPGSAAGMSAFLLVAEVVQFLIGDAGLLAVHLPLGIIVVCGALAAAGMVFRRRRPDAATDQAEVRAE